MSTREPAQADLHPLDASGLRVVPYTPRYHAAIREFLEQSEDLYPNIRRWWQSTVLPELTTGRRGCQIAVGHSGIGGLAIWRRGSISTKLCTLRVLDQYRELGLGTQLFLQVATDAARSNCKHLHFTVSEEVDPVVKPFFDRYGFGFGGFTRDCYTRGLDEIRYSARMHDVISGFANAPSARGDVALSIRPDFAGLIETGQKTVEFRRRFSKHLAGHRLFIYVTSPIKQFRLMAEAADVQCAHPAELWAQYSSVSGCTIEQFEGYFRGCEQGYAVALRAVRPLRQPVPADHPLLRAQGYRPPQSYAALRDSHVLELLASTEQMGKD